MGSSSKTNIEGAAAKLLAAAEDCFEVDDIAAFDPIVEPAAKSAAKRAPEVVAKDSSMEIELSGDDMDAMLGDEDVISVEVS